MASAKDYFHFGQHLGQPPLHDKLVNGSPSFIELLGQLDGRNSDGIELRLQDFVAHLQMSPPEMQRSILKEYFCMYITGTHAPNLILNKLEKFHRKVEKHWALFDELCTQNGVSLRSDEQLVNALFGSFSDLMGIALSVTSPHMGLKVETVAIRRDKLIELCQLCGLCELAEEAIDQVQRLWDAEKNMIVQVNQLMDDLYVPLFNQVCQLRANKKDGLSFSQEILEEMQAVRIVSAQLLQRLRLFAKEDTTSTGYVGSRTSLDELSGKGFAKEKYDSICSKLTSVFNTDGSAMPHDFEANDIAEPGSPDPLIYKVRFRPPGQLIWSTGGIPIPRAQENDGGICVCGAACGGGAPSCDIHLEHDRSLLVQQLEPRWPRIQNQLDTLTTMVTQYCHIQMCVVSTVDTMESETVRVTYGFPKGKDGKDVIGTAVPRCRACWPWLLHNDVSKVPRTVDEVPTLIVSDTSENRFFAKGVDFCPGGASVKFWAGAPIFAAGSDGSAMVVGVVSLIDSQPQCQFDGKKLAAVSIAISNLLMGEQDPLRIIREVEEPFPSHIKIQI